MSRLRKLTNVELFYVEKKVKAGVSLTEIAKELPGWGEKSLAKLVEEKGWESEVKTGVSAMMKRATEMGTFKSGVVMMTESASAIPKTKSKSKNFENRTSKVYPRK